MLKKAEERNDVKTAKKGEGAKKLNAPEELKLTTRRQLEIYMNPQRQRLLKVLELSGTSMTPKQLSEKLGISASSVSLHIGKLAELGLVALDHTELIHGITAKFYKKLPVSVTLCGNRGDDLTEERLLLLDYAHGQVWNNFLSHLRACSENQFSQKAEAANKPDGNESGKGADGTGAGLRQAGAKEDGPLKSTDSSIFGDAMNGVMYLNQKDAAELFEFLRNFTEAHAVPGTGKAAWEYAFTAFPHPISHTKKKA